MTDNESTGYVKPHGNYSKAQKLEAMARLCREIASTSHGVKTLCDADPLLPESRTIWKWLFDEVVDTTDTDKPLNQLYAQAKHGQMNTMGDELLSISDDDSNDLDEAGRSNNASVNRARLRTDTRKWLMSKLDRRNYGDKQELEVKDTTGLTMTELMRQAHKRASTGIGADENTAHSGSEASNNDPQPGKRLN